MATVHLHIHIHHPNHLWWKRSSSSIFSIHIFHPKKHLTAFKQWLLFWCSSLAKNESFISLKENPRNEFGIEGVACLQCLGWIYLRDRHVSIGETGCFFFPSFLVMIPLAYILNYGIYIGWAVTSFLFKCRVLQFCVFETVLKSYAIWYHVIAVYRYDISCINLHQPKISPENGRYIMAVSSCLSLGGSETAEKARLFRTVGGGIWKVGPPFFIGDNCWIETSSIGWMMCTSHSSIYLSICLSVSLSVCLPICLSVCLFVQI